jgi:hypothetical protein
MKTVSDKNIVSRYYECKLSDLKVSLASRHSLQLCDLKRTILARADMTTVVGLYHISAPHLRIKAGKSGDNTLAPECMKSLCCSRSFFVGIPSARKIPSLLRRWNTFLCRKKSPGVTPMSACLSV